MRNSTRAALTALCLTAFTSIAFAEREESEGQQISRHPRNPQAGRAVTAGGTTATTAITNHGGPVMGGNVNVYLIWYGNWNQGNGTDTPAGQQIVRDFFTYIGGSPYMQVNNTYSTATTLLTGVVNFGGETADSGSQGTALVVEGNIASGDRSIEGAATLCQTPDRFLELPEDLRIVRVTEIEIVGRAHGEWIFA